MIHDDSKIADKTYRYIKVVFDNYCQFEYSYRDDFCLAKEGDYVWVPVGIKNDKKIACVKSIGDFSAKNAPYPIDRTRRIIRVATEDETFQIEANW